MSDAVSASYVFRALNTSSADLGALKLKTHTILSDIISAKIFLSLPNRHRKSRMKRLLNVSTSKEKKKKTFGLQIIKTSDEVINVWTSY